MKTLNSLFIALLLIGMAIPSYATSTDTDEDVRTIIIRGTDDMKFDVTLIEAKPGEKLRITLETVSNMPARSEEHTSELQSRGHLVCRLLLEKKTNK